MDEILVDSEIEMAYLLVVSTNLVMHKQVNPSSLGLQLFAIARA